MIARGTRAPATALVVATSQQSVESVPLSRIRHQRLDVVRPNAAQGDFFKESPSRLPQKREN